MKKYCFILLCLCIFCFSRAQRSEVGTLIGTSFYMGDLNNRPFRDAKFAGGLVYRYNFTPRMALKANFLFGKITGSDEKNYSLQVLKDEKGNKLVDNEGNYVRKWNNSDRKLSFSSPITEIAAQLEINFFNVYTAPHLNQISPYLFGGAAVFSFNPQAVYEDGVTYDLQPMGTEGQGRVIRDEHGKIIATPPNKYNLTGFAIPFGIGFKANIGKFVCVGAEWGLRYTFTKYLDDVGGRYYDFSDENVSDIVKYFADPRYPAGEYPNPYHYSDTQRCSTTKNDWYSFAGVVITVRIGNEDRFCDIKTNVKLKHHKGRK